MTRVASNPGAKGEQLAEIIGSLIHNGSQECLNLADRIELLQGFFRYATKVWAPEHASQIEFYTNQLAEDSGTPFRV